MALKLKKIFSVDKVTYEAPGESREQECIFINVETASGHAKDAKYVARITGTCQMFGNADKIPFGFLSKAITKADSELTKDFFFEDIEGNTKYIGNIVQRSFSFVYFFRSQFDPKIGIINEITETTNIIGE